MNVLTHALALTLAAIVALGCESSPAPLTDRSDPDTIQALGNAALTRTLAEAEVALAEEDWLDAWRALDKAATLDTGRAHDLEIAEGRFRCGYALAIDGARVDLWGLLPDRQRGIEMLLSTARQHRFGDIAPKAIYYAAKAYVDMDEPDIAQIYLDQLVEAHAASRGGSREQASWAEAAEYLRATALLKAARTLEHDLQPLEEANWRLRMYLELYKDGRNRPQAQSLSQQVTDNLAERDYTTGAWYEWYDNPTAARIYFLEVVRRFPGTTWATLAEERLAGLPAPAEEWPPAPDAAAAPR